MVAKNKKHGAKRFTKVMTKLEQNRLIAERVGLQLSAAEEMVQAARPVLILINEHIGAKFTNRLRAAIKRWDDACQHGRSK